MKYYVFTIFLTLIAATCGIQTHAMKPKLKLMGDIIQTEETYSDHHSITYEANGIYDGIRGIIKITKSIPFGKNSGFSLQGFIRVQNNGKIPLPFMDTSSCFDQMSAVQLAHLLHIDRLRATYDEEKERQRACAHYRNQ